MKRYTYDIAVYDYRNEIDTFIVKSWSHMPYVKAQKKAKKLNRIANPKHGKRHSFYFAVKTYPDTIAKHGSPHGYPGYVTR